MVVAVICHDAGLVARAGWNRPAARCIVIDFSWRWTTNRLRIVVDLQNDRAIRLYQRGPLIGASIDVSGHFGSEPSEVGPGSASRQGSLECGDCLGIDARWHKRPTEGQRGKLAHLF